MPMPPGPFDERPNPLNAEIKPAEAIRHPAFGQVSAWIDKAMEGPPSPGTIGRMELVRHWDRLPAEKRQLLLLMAREMMQGETQ